MKAYFLILFRGGEALYDYLSRFALCFQQKTNKWTNKNKPVSQNSAEADALLDIPEVWIGDSSNCSTMKACVLFKKYADDSVNKQISLWEGH